MKAKSKYIILLFSLAFALSCKPAIEFDSVGSKGGVAQLVSYYTFDDKTADEFGIYNFLKGYRGFRLLFE